MTHNDAAAPTVATAYLWIAEQTHAVIFEATNSMHPPARAEVHGPAGSGNDDWRLLGTARATVVRSPEGATRIKMWTPLQYGIEFGLHEVVRNGWFSKA